MPWANDRVYAIYYGGIQTATHSGPLVGKYFNSASMKDG